MTSVASGESTQQLNGGGGSGNVPGHTREGTSMDIEGSSDNRNSSNTPNNNGERNAPAAGSSSSNNNSTSGSNGGNSNRNRAENNEKGEKGGNERSDNSSSSASSNFSKKLNEIMGNSKSGGAGENNSMEEEKNATELLSEYQQRLQELEELNQKLETEKSEKEKENSEISKRLSTFEEQEKEKNVNEIVGSFVKVLESIKEVEPVTEDDTIQKNHLLKRTEDIVEKYKKLYEKNDGKVNKEELDADLSLLMLSSNALKKVTNYNLEMIRQRYETQNREFRMALDRVGKRRPKSYASNVPDSGSEEMNKEGMHTASARGGSNNNNNNNRGGGGNESSRFDIYERVFGKRKRGVSEESERENNNDYLPSKMEILLKSSNYTELAQQLELRNRKKMEMSGKRPKASIGAQLSTIHVASAASNIRGFSTNKDNMTSFNANSNTIVPPHLRGYGPHNILPKNDSLMEKFRNLRDSQTTEFTSVPMVDGARELNEGEHQNYQTFFRGLEELRNHARRTGGDYSSMNRGGYRY